MMDLFCGMGGWSVGFYRHQYQCIGIDNIDVGYPYHLIQTDIRKFDGREFRGKVRAMMISPPCTEFSQITVLSAWKGQRPAPDPEGKGMELVKEGIRVMKEVDPKYWLLENVYGSRKYITELLGPPRVEAKPYLLWGDFPEFIFQTEPLKSKDKGFRAEKKQSGKWVIGKGSNNVGLPEEFAFDPLRSWKRARIPVFLAETLAKACSETE